MQSYVPRDQGVQRVQVVRLTMISSAISDKKIEIEMGKKGKGKEQDRGSLRTKKTEEKDFSSAPTFFFRQKLFWSPLMSVSTFVYLQILFWKSFRRHFGQACE